MLTFAGKGAAGATSVHRLQYKMKLFSAGHSYDGCTAIFKAYVCPAGHGVAPQQYLVCNNGTASELSRVHYSPFPACYSLCVKLAVSAKRVSQDSGCYTQVCSILHTK